MTDPGRAAGGDPSLLFICRLLWPGGIQRIVQQEALGLRKLGFQVGVLFLRRSERKESYFFDEPFRVFSEGARSFKTLSRVFELITMHYLPARGPDARVDPDYTFRAELSLGRPDLVVYTDQYAAMFAPLGRFLRSGRYVVLVQESGFKEGGLVRTLLERAAYSRAAVLVTTTNAIEGTLRGRGYRNVEVVRPGCEYPTEVPRFSQRLDEAISVTMWDSGRRPEVFIDIAAHLTKGKIVLAGSWADESYLDRIRTQVEDRNLTEKLTITGPIHESELRAHYARAKVGLRFGYREEGPGMGSLEAMANGIPLVINSGIGIRELLLPRAPSLVVDEADTTRIARLIEHLFVSEQEWVRLSTACREVVRPISWMAHNEKLAVVLRKAAAE